MDIDVCVLQVSGTLKGTIGFLDPIYMRDGVFTEHATRRSNSPPTHPRRTDLTPASRLPILP
jgi:hypothetical protein